MTVPIDPAWTISRIAIQIAAAVLVTIFAVGVRRVGALLARVLRVEERGGGLHVLLGLAVYVLLGTALGAVGWLHWPLLAGLALAPGGAAVVAALGGWARPLRRFVPRPPTRGRVLLGVCVALVAVPFLIDAITPPTHYDLLANYLAVAKDDLLQGGISPLEHNVHSSQSLALHVLLAYLLSLAEMVRAGSFVFDSAMTVPVFGLMALVLIVRSLTALARRLVPDGTDHRPVGERSGGRLCDCGVPRRSGPRSGHQPEPRRTAHG